MSKTLFDNVKPVVSVRPQDVSASTVNGAGVDIKGYNNALIVVEIGSASGSPSAQTVNAKVQESDTSGGTYTDITGAAIVEVTADDKSAQIEVLGLGTSTKRFLRVVITVGFTAGSSPKIEISGHVVLGGAENKPVGNSTTGA